MPSDTRAPEHRLVTGWGRTTATTADVTRPRSAGEVLGLLRSRSARGTIARGLGRSYGDPALNAGGTVLDMTGLGRVLAVDPDVGEVRVEAGASIDLLARVLLPTGWFLPVTPGTRSVTVGGAIATDVHGKNHHLAGSFGCHLRSIRLALADATVREVSPGRDPDLFWATVGGMGLTGVVLEATLRLLPVPSAWMAVTTERCGDLDGLLAALQVADRHSYSVAWIDLMTTGPRAGRGVVTSAEHAAVEDLPRRVRRRADELGRPARLRVPGWCPTGLLNPLSIAAFNEAWFRRAPSRPTQDLQPIGRYLHPLDGVRDWNLLYGARGLLQHQCVVPDESALRRLLDRIRGSRVPAFLAVLKRLGAADPAPLSFPRPGWTLAFDAPGAEHGIAELLDDLDDLVAAVGGSVYLAKDARMRPELLPTFYPRLDQWRAVRERVDPGRVLVSDQARRLGL